MNKYLIYVACLIALIPIEFFCLFFDYKKEISFFYIVLFIMSAVIGFFARNYKQYILILISRIIGTIISVVCTQLFINTFASNGYFKPFGASGYAIFLGILSQLIILAIIGIIFVFRPRRNK
ncbi:hypothetical protein [Staphylococcus pettenkoferi]|uniref:Uncharacterized protein n=1 Tax=Staphylococcus pettenkoferi TaxID=170573 RepID=A0A9Q4D4Q8_9STAP|nr:hypothetical protein [Staphylococcus pettenkoferi]MCY1569845.1 hypothetical protein [Staphylococcus pettenkoferi]MCY1576092.1 hypothetical protein [Staphylococcus pettenkoferi]MCY1593884.1 hypothetical protein [Staphylococcus pettenkoferi]MCY1617639.1 hypothetical protein [Staphylococcus pettenkoferi]